MSIKGQVLSFASKVLTETDKKYAQIEKELLVIVFGCKRFHKYQNGKDIIVFTDHKQLKFKKKNKNAACADETTMIAACAAPISRVHHV